MIAVQTDEVVSVVLDIDIDAVERLAWAIRVIHCWHGLTKYHLIKANIAGAIAEDAPLTIKATRLAIAKSIRDSIQSKG